MGPINFETVLLLMRNLTFNLSSPNFEPFEEGSAIKAAGKAWYQIVISDSDYTEFDNFTKWLGVFHFRKHVSGMSHVCSNEDLVSLTKEDHVNQKQYAIVSAIVAFAIPSLVQAHGHRFKSLP